MTAKPGELIELLKAHQAQEQPDWTTARDEYLHAVEGLYGQIRQWLEEAQKQGLVRVFAGGNVERSYEGLGYQAPVLLIEIGRKRIRFEPHGFPVIGARGRVDVDAGDRIAMLVLVDDDWFFARRTPKVQRFPLTEDTFTEALRELLGP